MSHIALSFSRLSTYEQCPYKFKRSYILKDVPFDDNNPYFIKGKKLHAQLENYCKAKNNPTIIQTRYDSAVQQTLPILDQLLASGHKLVPEQQLAVDKDWKPAGWFDKTVYWRAILDLIATKGDKGVLIDYKSGKFREYGDSLTGQLALAAAIAFAHNPEINEFTTAYLFIEHRQTIKRRFTREMFESDLLVPFNEAFVTVNTDEEFEPCKNGYCRFCDIKEDCGLW